MDPRCGSRIRPSRMFSLSGPNAKVMGRFVDSFSRRACRSGCIIAVCKPWWMHEWPDLEVFGQFKQSHWRPFKYDLCKVLEIVWNRLNGFWWFCYSDIYIMEPYFDTRSTESTCSSQFEGKHWKRMASWENRDHWDSATIQLNWNPRKVYMAS